MQRQCLFIAALWLLTLPALAELSAKIPSAIETRAHSGVLPVRYRTLLGIRLGRDSLKDVQHRFPGSKVFPLDNSDSSSIAICIRSSAKGDDTQVVFEAGPLGGFQSLTGMTIGLRSAFDPGYPCSTSPFVSKRLASAGALGLGSRLDYISKALGQEAGFGTSGLAEIPFERNTQSRAPRTGGVVDHQILSGIIMSVVHDEIQWFSVYFVEGS